MIDSIRRVFRRIPPVSPSFGGYQGTEHHPGNVKLSTAIARGLEMVAGEIHGHHGQCPFERRGHSYKLHATVIGMALLGSGKITPHEIDTWPDYHVSTHCIEQLNKARVSGEWPEEVVREVIEMSSTGSRPVEIVKWLLGRGE